MYKKRTLHIWLTILSIFMMVLCTLCISNNTSSSENNDKYVPQEDLEFLYLSSSKYLLPEPPGDDSKNKTELTAGKSTYFSHNLRDRKFNEALNPELDLWLDAHGKNGLVLRFEIGFQVWEDETLIEGKFYKIIFKNYTTTGATGGENVKVAFLEYDGVPFDIKYGTGNWASIYLMINLTENVSAASASVDIICGAGGKISSIKLPYDQTLSGFEHEQNKNNDGDSTWCSSSLVLVFAIGIIASVSFIYRNQNKGKYGKR